MIVVACEKLPRATTAPPPQTNVSMLHYTSIIVHYKLPATNYGPS